MADKGIDISEAEPAGPGRANGINYLLAIAIDEYEHCPRLYNCVQDARRLIRVLSTQYQFEPAHTFTLFNEQATEHAIIDMFKKLVRLIRPEDNLLILFSGHGEYEAAIEEGYWIPVDAPLGHTNEYIANSRIVKYIKAIQSHHTFLIVDSCFSGSLFASRSLEQTANTNRLDEIASRWLLTAGRNEVVSDGKPGNHSPFADNVIYFLENNQEPSLSVTALISRVVNAVIHNARQTPRGEPLQDTGHRGGQFYFYRKGVIPNRKATPPTGPEQALSPPPRTNYRKYGLIAAAALAVLVLLLVRQVARPAAAKNTEKREQISHANEPKTIQARYDSLITVGVGLFQQAKSPQQYKEALARFGQALQLAEEYGLNTEQAKKGIRQCRQMLPSPSQKTPLPSELKQEQQEEAPVNDYATLLAKGRSLFQNGNFAAASQALAKALKINPQGKEARSYLQKCREELDWQRAGEAATEEGYRAYLKAYPDGRHTENAQREIAALHRYDLYFTTSLKQDNLLTINIGRGKAPFDITIKYLATGEQIRKTAPNTQPFEVSLSQFNSDEGKHMVEIIVRDHNFKARGQKMPLLR